MRVFDQDTYEAFAELLAQPDPPDLPGRSSIPLLIGEPQPKWEISLVDGTRRDPRRYGPEGCLK